jgi:Flp pilus assembly pilin Flp
MQKELHRLKNDLKQLVCDDRGTETLEWVLVAGLVIISTITLVAVFGTKLRNRWTSINTVMT